MLYNKTEKLCKKCVYSTHMDYLGDKSTACYYIGCGKGSRVFNQDGSKRIPSDKCDKFEPQKGRRLTGHQKLQQKYKGV